MDNRIQSRAVQRAAEIADGPEALAAYLNVPATWVSSWIDGGSPIPQSLFLRVVEMIVDQGSAGARGAIPDSLLSAFRHRDAANG